MEEGFDLAQLCRGFIAELRDLLKGTAADYVWLCQVPPVGVTAAKDSCDRLSTDTGLGSQKSLCFTIAALRQRLNTCFRWTGAFLAEEHELLQFCTKLGSEPGWRFVSECEGFPNTGASLFSTSARYFLAKNREARPVAIA